MKETLLILHRHPYSHGARLSLRIEEHSLSSLDATVIKVFKPFTLSCVLAVQLNYPQLRLNGKYILKLYDRRFATQLREEEVDYSWDDEIEDKFRKFVSDGYASSFFDYCAEHDAADKEARENCTLEDCWVCDAQEHWNIAQHEAYLQYRCRKLYKTEVKVYHKLHSIQGQYIPRFEGRVVLESSQTSPPFDIYLGCPGILLEFIEGFPLEDLAHVPPGQQHTLRSIGEGAIQIVNHISAQGIRNEDIKTRSFIIHQDPGTRELRPYMIDFGNCVLRMPGQSDVTWEYWKAVQDEEGATGKMIEKILGAKVFKYTRTAEFAKLHSRYMRG
jgi:hypothetical protein